MYSTFYKQTKVLFPYLKVPDEEKLTIVFDHSFYSFLPFLLKIGISLQSQFAKFQFLTTGSFQVFPSKTEETSIITFLFLQWIFIDHV